MQIEAVSLHLINYHLRKETGTLLTTISFQVIVDSSEAPLNLLFSNR